MLTMSLSETATLDLDTGRNDLVPQTPTSITLGQVLRKYFRIFRASLIERMVYRADFLLGTVLRFLPMITTILLWEAIYTGSGKKELDGYSRDDMIAYLLLVHISR